VHVGDGHKPRLLGRLQPRRRRRPRRSTSPSSTVTSSSNPTLSPGSSQSPADPAIRHRRGQAFRLAENPELLNTAGNEIHFSVQLGRPLRASPPPARPRARDVAGAMAPSPCCAAPSGRTSAGFEERYFAFHEDAELSWRCWQRGLRVRYVPDAMSACTATSSAASPTSSTSPNATAPVSSSPAGRPAPSPSSPPRSSPSSSR